MPIWMVGAIMRMKAARDWARQNPAEVRILGYGSALIALCVLGITATMYVAHLKDRLGKAQLQASNAEALADVTHRALLSREDSIRFLGDSLQLVQRLVVQREQERDALDKALRQTRVAKLALTAKVDSLLVRNVASTAPVKTDSAGTRTASFHVRQAPYTADASVTLPAIGTGRLDLSVRLDSAGVELRLGCGDPKNGVRPAIATLKTPTWLHLTVAQAEQEPAMCNKGLGESPALKHWRPALSVGPSYNLVHLPDGTWRSAWGISGQLSVFHWP